MKGSKKAYCAACDSDSVDHFALWVANSSDMLPFETDSLYRNPLLRPFARLGEWLLSLCGRISFFVLKLTGIASLRDGEGLNMNRRSQVMQREAHRRGIPMRQLILFGVPTERYEVQIAGATHLTDGLPVPPRLRDDSNRMDDKVAFKRVMRAHGLPVPMSHSVRTLREAKRAKATHETVCVKPRFGSNGRHTYPFVQTEEDLVHAFRSAKQLCYTVSVEEHLEGSLCRATCVDGKLVGFMQSHYPTVTGDGSSTIATLIEKANAERPEGVGEIVMTELHHAYIKRRGYTVDDVLPEGVNLPLIYWAGRGAGGRNREYGRSIHPSFIPLIEQAAVLTELPVVGFDIIIPDPLSPADSQLWGFIEANSFPWINLHEEALWGEPVSVAEKVWDLWVPETRLKR